MITLLGFGALGICVMAYLVIKYHITPLDVTLY